MHTKDSSQFSIDEWKEAIGVSAHIKFPRNKHMDVYDRLESIQRQLDDVRGAIKVEGGILESADHAHQDPNHRIAALIADILILAYDRNADVGSELKKVHEWFLQLDI